MAYKVTSGPTTEPITLAEAKEWLKIHPDVSEDDELVRALIATVRTWAERSTGQALLTQTIQEVWDYATQCLCLSIGPLISVTSFEYKNSHGAYGVLDSSNYTVDNVSNPGRVVINDAGLLPTINIWPTYPNAIRITYTAGVATPSAVDANVKTAMLLMLRLMYDNREDMPLGKETSVFARTAWNLLSMSRTSLI